MFCQKIICSDAEIFFCEKGKGDAIVLIHGFTESLEIWDEFSLKLSENYRVITIDLPGHGRTKCSHKEYTMEMIADCVKLVLETIQVKNCLMIGHSMGGYVALAFADKYPYMLKGFGLFHSTALADSLEAKENRKRTIEIAKHNHINFLQNFIPDLFAPENVERLKNEIENLKKEAQKNMTSDGIIASQNAMLNRKDYLNLLASTELPVLFIFGKKDKRIPFDKASLQINLPIHSEVTILDVGHMGYLEAPKETLHSIESYANLVFSKI